MININFNQHSIEDLRQLNKELVDHIRLRIQRESQISMGQFEYGDRVSFQSSQGRIIEGKIIRFNKKSVTIQTDCQHEWRVSPQILQKVIEANKINQDQKNIIEIPRKSNVGRNSPCPCGSGKKYKRCCLNSSSQFSVH